MTRNFKVRFPNESTWDIIPLHVNLFEPLKEFEKEIFGFYEGVYISILKETKDVFEEGN